MRRAGEPLEFSSSSEYRVKLCTWHSVWLTGRAKRRNGRVSDPGYSAIRSLASTRASSTVERFGPRTNQSSRDSRPHIFLKSRCVLTNSAGTTVNSSW